MLIKIIEMASQTNVGGVYGSQMYQIKESV